MLRYSNGIFLNIIFTVLGNVINSMFSSQEKNCFTIFNIKFRILNSLDYLSFLTDWLASKTLNARICIHNNKFQD